MKWAVQGKLHLISSQNLSNSNLHWISPHPRSSFPAYIYHDPRMFPIISGSKSHKIWESLSYGEIKQVQHCQASPVWQSLCLIIIIYVDQFRSSRTVLVSNCFIFLGQFKWKKLQPTKKQIAVPRKLDWVQDAQSRKFIRFVLSQFLTKIKSSPNTNLIVSRLSGRLVWSVKPNVCCIV